MKVPCTIMRGGTSKGIILRDDDLPRDPDKREAVILRIFGSPDRRQIDGLGGADPLTSKLAIVGPSARDDADIDYSFGQVLIDEAKINYGGYCGNLAAAVAAYAVDEGYVTATGSTAVVRIHCTSVARLITAEVPVEDGRARQRGDVAIAGVPGTGAPIKLDFTRTAGSISGSLLPLGRTTTMSAHEDGRLTVVDIGNPVVFLDRKTFGFKPTDGPDEIDSRVDLLDSIEEIRVTTARQCGICRADGAVSDDIPLVVLVGSPADYQSYSSGRTVRADEMDLWAREIFLKRTHKTFGVAETVCTAVAAALSGTVVNHRLRPGALGSGRVRIGHPCGVIDAEVSLDETDGVPAVRHVSVVRTARRILDGQVYV